MVSHFLEKIAFLLCLIFQGLYVKWRIVKLPEPSGSRNGINDSVSEPNISLLVLGDSAAAGVGADHQEQALLGQLVAILGLKFRLRWQLRANTGATTASELIKLRNLNEAFDYVVVSLGVNDITGAVSQQRWLKQQAELISILQEKIQAQQIILSSLPPIHEFYALPQPLRVLMARRALRFTAALKRMVYKEPAVVVLDLPALNDTSLTMASDSFHPGPTVYKVWAEATAKVIEKHYREHRRLT